MNFMRLEDIHGVLRLDTTLKGIQLDIAVKNSTVQDEQKILMSVETYMVGGLSFIEKVDICQGEVSISIMPNSLFS